ncbi:MAG: hypothetical protein MUF56_08535 [Solirubrobacteraceae bacterium]|nr:hypothetical protein [Solirubrobacteraceae bacterium]
MLSSAPSAPIFEPVPARSGNARRGNRRRLAVFLGTLAITAIPALAWVYLQPAEYRATALVQIDPGALAAPVPPPAGSPQIVTDSTESPRPLATEVQVLRSRPLVEAALAKLPAAERTGGRTDADPVAATQAALDVRAFEDTRVVQVDATLPDRERVAPLVNALVTAYRERLASSFGTASNETLARTDEEVQRLEAQVAAKRRAIELFRAQNAIVSADVQENEVLARVRGLNTSLATANDKLAAAEGKLRSVQQSAQAGRAVARAKDDPTLASMEQRASQLRAKLREQERNFTPDYLALDPTARAERAQLADLEEQIKVQRTASQQTAIVEAQEEVQSAREAAARIREQIGSERAMAQTHVARLAQYKGMQDELAELERLFRDRAQRRASLEASEATRAPAVQVLQSATRPDRAFRPDYTRDATLALAGSLLASLLVMGLVELFNRSEREPGVLIAQPISVHGPSLGHAAAPALPGGQVGPALASPPAALLGAHPLPVRELGEDELAALWQAATPAARAAIGLLLSGLSPEEVVAFDLADADAGAGRVRVRGATVRELPVQPPVLAALAACPGSGGRLYAGGADAGGAREALEADLLCAAHDADLARPEDVTPEALRHAYLLHLVRQGARMSDIAALAGRLSPATISSYAGYAPAGARVALDPARAAFPLLARMAATPQGA